MKDLLIRGGTVVDGTGGPIMPADVRIRGGVITEIGHGLRPDGDDVLDASGAYVAPGFIDSHTHVDPSLFWDPLCDPMPQHGVTTVLAGNCSLSLAPVRAEHRDAVATVFCYIEDLPRDVFDGSVSWAWETYGEYRQELLNSGFGVNAAFLVGHTPLRLFVMGDDAWERPATAEEITRMAWLLEDCLGAGAFGVSTSYFDEDPEGRPVPSTIAEDAELGALFDVLGRRGGVVEFVPNVRQADYSAQVERIAALCGPRGVVATWNGLFWFEKRPELARTMLARAGELQAAGTRIYPQVSPRTLDNRINWNGGMSFSIMTESWHQFVQTIGPDKRQLLDNPAWRARARADWEAIPPHNKLCDLSHYRFIDVGRPEHEPWVDRTLADLVVARGGHPSDVLADWLLDNDLQAGVVRVGIANADPDGVAETLVHPASIISNSDAGAHVKMMCASGDTTLLLTRFVRDRGDLSVERAVWELTGRQAEIFGFGNRGTVAVGNAADLTIFALDELEYRADALVEDLPGGGQRLRRPWGGYRYTVTGGVVTQQGGQLSGARPGRVLDRGRAARTC